MEWREIEKGRGRDRGKEGSGLKIGKGEEDKKKMGGGGGGQEESGGGGGGGVQEE